MDEKTSRKRGRIRGNSLGDLNEYFPVPPKRRRRLLGPKRNDTEIPSFSLAPTASTHVALGNIAIDFPKDMQRIAKAISKSKHPEHDEVAFDNCFLEMKGKYKKEDAQKILDFLDQGRGLNAIKKLLKSFRESPKQKEEQAIEAYVRHFRQVLEEKFPTAINDICDSLKGL
jgi:hypothetical protein